MSKTLTFKLEPYLCVPCSEKQGTLVCELVRMIPASVVAFGKLIGDEFFCCPICFEPKFEVKSRKPVKPRKSDAVEKQPVPAAEVSARPRIRLVTSKSVGSDTAGRSSVSAAAAPGRRGSREL